MAQTNAAREAQLALRRFGLGARPGEVAALAGRAREHLLASLQTPKAVLLDDIDLDSSDVAYANMQLAQRQAKAQRESQQEALRQAMGVPYPRTGGAPPAAVPDKKGFARPALIRGEVFQDEAAVRFDRLVTTDHPFLERLVMYWANHFCVSATKGVVRGLAGAYEREAVRPHVLGRFVDMLLASVQHPAMLHYLDNHLSIGPNSQAGLNRKKGLNENHAREILELHTLGVDGGYAQDDVTNLARLLTGWTVGNLGQGRDPGKFHYAAQRREPGTFKVAGKSYPNLGVEAAQQALRDLAAHPSTARHVARRFAAHFVADAPPAALVAKLEASFLSTGGDLAALARTLVTADEAWIAPMKKMLPPNDFLTAAVRGLPFKQRPRSAEIVRLSNQLGQPLWHVPSPRGWPEENDAWAGPSALRERLRIAEVVVGQMDKTADPRALADDVLGGALADTTRQAIARAETKDQGFQLLIMSPEFQRR